MDCLHSVLLDLFAINKQTYTRACRQGKNILILYKKGLPQPSLSFVEQRDLEELPGICWQHTMTDNMHVIKVTVRAIWKQLQNVVSMLASL